MKVIWLRKSNTTQQERPTREEIGRILGELQNAVEQLNNILTEAWKKENRPDIKEHLNWGLKGLLVIREKANSIAGILQQTKGELDDDAYNSIQNLAREAATWRTFVARALTYIDHAKTKTETETDTGYLNPYDTMSEAIRKLSGGY
jgi:hypothetical protein